MHLSLVLKGIPPLHYCTVIQHQSSLIGCRFKKPGPNCCNRRDACCVEDTQSANTVCFSHLTRASHFRDNNPLPTYLPLKGELSCSLVFWWHIKDPLCPSLSLSLSLPFPRLFQPFNFTALQLNIKVLQDYVRLVNKLLPRSSLLYIYIYIFPSIYT